jgi:hypothetical protein
VKESDRNINIFIKYIKELLGLVYTAANDVENG